MDDWNWSRATWRVSSASKTLVTARSIQIIELQITAQQEKVAVAIVILNVHSEAMEQKRSDLQAEQDAEPGPALATVWKKSDCESTQPKPRQCTPPALPMWHSSRDCLQQSHVELSSERSVKTDNERAPPRVNHSTVTQQQLNELHSEALARDMQRPHRGPASDLMRTHDLKVDPMLSPEG